MSLITAEELTRLIADGPAVLLDVRWRLDKPCGYDDYCAGHIPGAQYVDLDTDLAQPPSAPTAGRHPLPSAEDFQACVRRWGIDHDTPVVVYDAGSCLGAARAWWLLRWAGLDDVRILDGGLAAWQAAGGQLSTDEPTVAPSEVTLSCGAMPTVDADEAAASAALGTLIDARAPERFRGEVEPMDPRAGHIPGAVNRPATANVVDGRFVDRARLAEDFRALGAGEGPIVAYCGSGVTACLNIFALEQAGFTAALFPPSWSGWSADPHRPVAVVGSGADSQP